MGEKRTSGTLDAMSLPQSIANRRPMNEKQRDLLRLTEVSANTDSMT